MATFTGRPAVSGDDGHVWSSSINIVSVYSLIGHYDGVPFSNFIRIPNVTVPQGADISLAKLTFKAYNSRSDNTLRLNIFLNDEDDAVAPTTKAQYDGKARTTAFVAWDGEEAWSINSLYDTPDFKSAVQEVVDRGSWASGNAIMVLIDDDGTDAAAFREGDTQDLGETTAALLTIEYTTLPTPSPVAGVIVVIDPEIGTYDTRFKLRARKRDTALTARVRNE